MSRRGGVRRAFAVGGIAFAQLRRAPGRTALAALGVALAVLAATLLASLGVGAVETGQDGLDGADRDLWIAAEDGDPTDVGTTNGIAGANAVAAELSDREDVDSAAPIAMYDVYLGPDAASAERVPAVGVYQTHDRFDFEAGGGFDTDRNLESSPDEATVGEIVLDPRVADEHDVSVGDTVVAGASARSAGDAEFTVVGISDYHSQFLGSPAATVPIVDLQSVAGTTGSDRATFVVADAAGDADPAAVRDDLDAAYPEYDVRTSDEQIGAMAADRPLVVASGLTLVGLAVVGGVVLTTNLFAIVAYQQRDELAALRAVGLSRGFLAWTIGAQGFLIGLLGGGIALLSTPAIVTALNRLVAAVVGFEGLLRTPPEVYLLGVTLALLVGTVVAVVTGWRAGRYARIGALRG